MPSAGMGNFVASHRMLFLGGGVLVALVVGGKLLAGKTATTSTAAGAVDSFGNPVATDGVTGGIVYVPTQTSFITNNAGAFSNDPQLQTVADSGNKTTTVTTTAPKTVTVTGSDGTKTTVPGIPPVVPHPPPPRPPSPTPSPPPTKGQGLIWDTRRTILGGETLSSIAAQQTRYLVTKGMPGSMSITWNDLWAHNQAVITQEASAHHNPIPGGAWNDVFPGEVIIVPRWG